MAEQNNFFQEELLKALETDISSGAIVVSTDQDHFFDEIWKCFPFAGSKIRWSKVPGAMSRKIDMSNLSKSILDFFDETVIEARLEGNDLVIVLGDSAVDVALTMSINQLRMHLMEIVDLPQHTYIVPANVSWCLCYTMEGFMDFGFSQVNTR